MKKILVLLSLLAPFASAHANAFETIEERATSIEQQLQGQKSYHAHLARQLLNLAREESIQHDPEAALEFMALADEQVAFTTTEEQP